MLRPRRVEEVAALVALAATAGVAIVPQGGNTGLVGGGIPDHSGRQVVLSLTGLDRIRSVDPLGEWLVAEAGCTLATVQAAAEGAGAGSGAGAADSVASTSRSVTTFGAPSVMIVADSLSRS